MSGYGADASHSVKGFLKGDIIVITSDGLTNMVNEDKIYEIVTTNLENSAEELIKQANNAGGIDNITVVIINNN